MTRKPGKVGDVVVETKRKPRTTRKPANPKTARATPPPLNETANGQITKETLIIDLSAAMVDRIRQHSSDWESMTVTMQADVKRDCRDAAIHMVTECLKVVAGNGSPAVKVQLGDLNGKSKKGAIEGRYYLKKDDEQRLLLLDSCMNGNSAYLVLQEDELEEEEGAKQDRLV